MNFGQFHLLSINMKLDDEEQIYCIKNLGRLQVVKEEFWRQKVTDNYLFDEKHLMRGVHKVVASGGNILF